jgi:hypothetical protein
MPHQRHKTPDIEGEVPQADLGLRLAEYRTDARREPEFCSSGGSLSPVLSMARDCGMRSHEAGHPRNEFCAPLYVSQGAPAEWLLDALPFPLAHRVSGVARGAAVVEERRQRMFSATCCVTLSARARNG